MTITQQMVLLSSAEFWLFFGLTVLLSAAGLYFSFRYLARARIVEDTPTAKVRSAQQGYVELAGRAQLPDDEQVSAPLSGSRCCWYRYKIEKRGNKSWRTLESDTSDRPFLLRDDTGACLVEPRGAEVTPGTRKVWYGSSRRPPGAPRTPGAQLKLGGFLKLDLGFGGRYRYTEELIPPGAAIYAIGFFSTWGEIERQREHGEIAGGLLRQWKQDQPALLARFDRDRDGKIDSQEWAVARRSAGDQAAYLQRQRSPQRLLHSLRTMDSPRHPFLLSTLPQFRLVKRFRWLSAAALGVFFTCGAISVWMLVNRLSG